MKPRNAILLVTTLLINHTLNIIDLQGKALSSSSETSALQYLRNTQDKYHRTFDVYTDQDAGGNHFTPTGWMCQSGYMPEEQLEYEGDWLKNSHSGTTCIKITYTYSKGHSPWAGIYWLYPENNWGTIPNAGYNLTGTDSLVFWAKGEGGGEWLEFFTLGVDGSYGDSSPRVPSLFKGYKQLDTVWTKYSIDLHGKDLSYVIGGFGFSAAASRNNYQDITFYLDDIYYVLGDSIRQQRLKGPHLLLSYEASFDTTDYNEDFAIRNTAFTDDNTKVMLALMADTSNLESEDWNRAKLIGDAFVVCQDSDRYFDDGRLRNGYQAGDLIDRHSKSARLPGWWDYTTERWIENEYAASTYTGNMAWVIIAWLHYYRQKPEPSYLRAAEVLGKWIRDRYDSVVGGYRGGFEGFEPTQIEVDWMSVEHNILIYAAFEMLYQVIGDTTWFDWAKDAREWVENTWNNPSPGRFPDFQTNVHALAYLYLGDFYAPGLNWVEENCLVNPCPKGDSFIGFDYNDDRDGIWFEGTAQMSLAFQKEGEVDKSDKYLREVEKAQINARNADSLGIVEACHDSVTTGQIDWRGNPVLKNNRLHIGTTSWYILAKYCYLPDVIESYFETRSPASYSLEPNYPNPFNESTSIRYLLPKVTTVTLAIYNVLGQQVKTLVEERQHAGYYSVGWDGKDALSRSVPSSVYFCRIIADNFVKTRKMLMLR